MSNKELKTTIIVFAITIIAFLFCIEIQDNYIQNLEEKVNMLTLDYENFVVEDSLRQVE